MTSLEVGAATVLALAACAADCRSARIPNVLTVVGATAGVAFNLVVGGPSHAFWSLGGVAAGMVLFFPFFALGGLGAGDVKLLAALGAWLGPIGALWTALYGAVAGGIMAVAVALARGYLRTALANVSALLGHWQVAGIQPLDGLTLKTATSPKLPYALPIAAGLFATLWFH
jgi:prepilin peptidase CpaA